MACIDRSILRGLLAGALVLGSGLVACGNSADARADRAQESAAAEVVAEAAPAPSARTPVAEGPVRIGAGQTVDLNAHLAAGEYTVFDFMSDYCPPCRQIAPWMDRLHAERDDVTVVKVDINRPGQRGIDWGSPVARQFGLRSIPHFKIYDPEGKLVAEGDAAWQMLTGWLEKLPAVTQG